MGIPVKPGLTAAQRQKQLQRSPNALQRRLLQASPLRKSVVTQQMLRQHRTKSVKRACAIKSRSAKVGVRPAVRVLRRRTCRKELETRKARQIAEKKAAEVPRAFVQCSSPAVARVLRSLDDERAERVRYVKYGNALPESPSESKPIISEVAQPFDGMLVKVEETPGVKNEGPEMLPLDRFELVPPTSRVKRGLKHDRRMKHEEFEKSTRFVKFRHAVATFMCMPKVYFEDVWWHVGDVVSVLGHTRRTYYAQVRGFFCDQYGENSCMITWLIPKPEFRKERHDHVFDPKKFKLGYEDPEPRKLSVLRWISRAPSDYFKVDEPVAPKSSPKKGFVWTTMGPVEVTLDDVHRAAGEEEEEGFVKELEASARQASDDNESLCSDEEYDALCDRIADMIEAKNKELKERAAKKAAMLKIKFGEVRPLAPQENKYGEEMVVMSKKTYDALISSKKEEFSAFVQARYGQMLPPVVKKVEVKEEANEVLEQEEEDEESSSEDDDEEKEDEREDEPMEDDEETSTADEFEDEEPEDRSLEFCGEMVLDESGKEDATVEPAEDTKLNVSVAGCELLPDWQEKSEQPEVDEGRSRRPSVSSLRERRARTFRIEKKPPKVAEDFWPSFMADHIYSRPPCAAIRSVQS